MDSKSADGKKDVNCNRKEFMEYEGSRATVV
jgi:hypothetical protein